MSSFLAKINLEKYNKKHLGILFIVGLLLIVISMPTSSSSLSTSTAESLNLTEENEYSDVDYKTQMENQLTELLYQVEGVGEVQVMITLSSTSENSEIIEGVVVIASEGDNSIVVKNITEMVQALFDVDTHKIKIMKMKSE